MRDKERDRVTHREIKRYTDSQMERKRKRD